ncbi:hypothetical protein chiPu_0029506, partial [Chiloscyllium punctatum]|nr:hypothetical protein [Chiloscyllium punctatum]
MHVAECRRNNFCEESGAAIARADGRSARPLP